MNASEPATTEQSNASNEKPPGDRKKEASNSSFHHHSAYLSRNPGGYFPSYNPVYYPGSYNHLSYSSAALNNEQATLGYTMPNNTTSNPPPHSHIPNWNRFSLPSPLTSCSTTGNSTSIPHTKTYAAKGISRHERSLLPNPSERSSNEYIDPKVLEAAHALNLPPGGQKYSVEHWKGALALCYRWKTTTNEEERKFHRKSTTLNSLSSLSLKSIKFFCENILQRKTKRRQFAIHWKESGLKNIVDESASSDANFFEYNDPKLDKVLDDYFSGRTRSNGYNQAKERVLEDRQKEILRLWDELMSGSVLSDASSHQKLYLLQLLIEKPYRNKKVEIGTKDKKAIYDVAIQGYGGKSYWEKIDPGATGRENKDASIEALPRNEMMNKRFWKSAGAFSPTRQEKKRRRLENDEKSKNSQLLLQSVDVLSKEPLKTRENSPFEEDKENDKAYAV